MLPGLLEVMTMKDELKELVEGAEARASKATPGEWWHQMKTLPPTQGVVLRAHYVLAVDADHRVVAGGFADVFFPEEDAKFIAHARQDVPALCAAVRELDAERDAERLTWVSCASLLGLWHVDPARYRPLLDAALKKLAEHDVPSHIIMALTPADSPPTAP
jgi:hypothetical protein